MRPNADSRGSAAGSEDEARMPPGGASGCPALERQGASADKGRSERDDTGRPEDRGKAEGLAQGATGDATDDTRNPVAEHRVQRLAAAAQAPREIAGDQGDAGGVLGREAEGMQQLGSDEQGDVAGERGDEREAHRRSQRGEGEPGMHRKAVQPASLE